MSSWIKLLGALITVIFLLVIGLVIFSQTGAFRRWLTDRIAIEAKKSLNGELHLGEIQGNLIRQIEIADVKLVSQGDTVITTPKLTIRLSALHLFKRELVIGKLLADSVHLHLVQRMDSTWNVTDLIKPTERPPADSQMQRDWHILIEDLQIAHGKVDMSYLPDLHFLPKQIADVQARATVTLTGDETKVKLRQAQFYTVDPDLRIDELSLQLASRGQNVNFSHLSLRTKSSHITGEIAVYLGRSTDYQFRLQASPLDLKDMLAFVPDLPVRGTPEVQLSGLYASDSLQFNLGLFQEEQALTTVGTVADLQRMPRFSVEAEIEQLDLSRWLNRSEIKSHINGNIRVKGTGSNLLEAQMGISADLHHLRFAEYSAKEAHLRASYDKGALAGKLSVAASFGAGAVEARLIDVNDSQTFDLEGSLENLNLAPLTQNDTLKSDIDLTFAAKGAGFDPKDMQAEFRLRLLPSDLAGIQADSGVAQLRWSNGRYIFDTLRIFGPTATVNMNGSGDVKVENHLSFDGRLFEPSWLKNRLEADSLKAQGVVSGRIYGKSDSLFVDAEYRLTEIIYDLVAVDSARGALQFFYSPDSMHGRTNTLLKTVSISQVEFDSARVETSTTNIVTDIGLAFSRANLVNGQVNMTYLDEALPRLFIHSADLNLQGQHWRGGTDSMQVLLGEDYYELKNMRLASGTQYIQTEGALRLQGQEGLHLEIGGFDLSLISALLKNPIKISGTLDASAKLGGTADSLIFSGTVSVDSGCVNEFAFKSLNGILDYRHGRSTLELYLDRSEHQGLKIIGNLPMNLSLAAATYTLPTDQPIRITITADSLDLSLLQAFSEQASEIAGNLACNIEVSNTFESPCLSGIVKVTKGTFAVPRYGARYHHIKFTIGADSNSVSLNGFSMRGGEGTLKASGVATLDSGGIQNGMNDIKLKIYADNFLAADGPALNVVLKGEAQLSGDLDTLRYGGSVIVQRSRLNVPALANVAESAVSPSQPMLIMALNRQDASATQEKQLKVAKADHALLENLRGNLKLNIPRNTWLRSPEMNIEISGDLELVKDGPDFELFGSIKTVRGTYDLYGKRFDLQKGNFHFQGGATLDPEIDIEAKHLFRGLEGNKDDLRLFITGRMLAPNLRFTLNGNAIEETDAISYLVFGRAFDQLTQGEKTNLAQQPVALGGSTFSAALASQVLGQISSTLQNRLNLDVIEFQGEQNWRQATFIVGKYITNDLFLSYQRRFNFGRFNEAVPEQVAIEYEITRFLFLQAIKGDEKTSGFDLLWKFEW